MEKICCARCGAPLLLDFIIRGESEDENLQSIDMYMCSNRGCGLLHNKDGDWMVKDDKLLFFSIKEGKVIAIPVKKKGLLM